jgi:ABC-type nitrate/sulfonate/bicarbonate transport system ATPase subunit
VSLELRSAGKHFGTLTALQEISFHCAEGEFIAVVGPSGCGKSTLLRLIAGLDMPTTGLVCFNQTPVRQPSSERALVLQDRVLYPWLTLEANVAMGLELARKPRLQARQEARSWLARLGLAGFEEYYPHQVSGGMAQRASLAQVLAVQPRLLLLDEPFGSLDALTRLGLQQVLHELWQELGFGVVMVTHDVDEAVYLANRVMILTPRPGRILTDLSIPLSHPRNRDETAFIKLRRDVLAQLGIPSRDGVHRR